MYLDDFIRFNRDLDRLNPNELTLVTYDKSTHTLSFHQLNYTFIATYLNQYFLPKKGFKVGALTPSGLNKLRYAISQLIATSDLMKEKLVPDLKPLAIGWFKCFSAPGLPSPKEVNELKFVNVTSKFLTWILCNTFNKVSKVVYEVVTKDVKAERSDIVDDSNLVSNAAKIDNLTSGVSDKI